MVLAVVVAVLAVVVVLVSVVVVLTAVDSGIGVELNHKKTLRVSRIQSSKFTGVRRSSRVGGGAGGRRSSRGVVGVHELPCAGQPRVEQSHSESVQLSVEGISSADSADLSGAGRCGSRVGFLVERELNAKPGATERRLEQRLRGALTFHESEVGEAAKVTLGRTQE